LVKAPLVKAAAPWKGVGKGKEKGKEKGKAKGKDQPGGEQFFGLIYQEGATTGNMLIKAYKVVEKYGQEAMLPKLMNPAGATVGDRISFEVLEREPGARPLATSVEIRGKVKTEDLPTGPSTPLPRTMKEQVLYYLSDENLRKDKFFHDLISVTPGGWLGMQTILGCRRMQQMGATAEKLIEQLRDVAEIEVRETPGQEAVRRLAPLPPLEVSTDKGDKGKGKGKGGKGGGGSWGAVSSQDTFYAGIVAKQSQSQPHKFLITCDEVKAQFKQDAFFLREQKPPEVDVGSLVVFTILAPGNSATPGWAPKAAFIARLAGVGSLGQSEIDVTSDDENKKRPGGAGAPGVKRDIEKQRRGIPANWYKSHST